MHDTHVSDAYRLGASSITHVARVKYICVSSSVGTDRGPSGMEC